MLPDNGRSVAGGAINQTRIKSIFTTEVTEYTEKNLSFPQ